MFLEGWHEIDERALNANERAFLKELLDVEEVEPLPNPQQWPDRARMDDPNLARVRARGPVHTPVIKVVRESHIKRTCRRFGVSK